MHVQAIERAVAAFLAELGGTAPLFQ